MSAITSFIKHHYRHFNAAALIDAAEAYNKHLANGGKMFITIGGAMSTAELGLSLAEMIRQDKVHGISCTGANLEEDVFNLVAHDFYERVPHYRDLTPADEAALLSRHMNRVTDTCIPEMEEMCIRDRLSARGWPEIPLDGRLLMTHQDALLLGGKVQAMPGFADHVSFRNAELCAACSQKTCIAMCSGQALTHGASGVPDFEREKCIHCGACLWNCAQAGANQSNIDFGAGAGGLRSAEN